MPTRTTRCWTATPRATWATVRSATQDHDTDILNFSARDFQAVHETGRGKNGRSMLVVMKHRNIHFFFQAFLNIEAFGRLYVLKVYPAECRFHGLHYLAQFIRVGNSQFNVKNIHIRECFKQDGFSFHNRLCRSGTDVAEAENSRAVRISILFFTTNSLIAVKSSALIATFSPTLLVPAFPGAI